MNKLENGNLLIESYDLTQIRNNVNVWHTDVNRLLFLENYVPLTLTDDDYLYFEIRDASLLQKMSSTKYHIIIKTMYLCVSRSSMVINLRIILVFQIGITWYESF